MPNQGTKKFPKKTPDRPRASLRHVPEPHHRAIALAKPRKKGGHHVEDYSAMTDASYVTMRLDRDQYADERNSTDPRFYTLVEQDIF